MNKNYEQLHEEAQKYVGLILEEVKVQLIKEGKSCRVLHQDGEAFVGTCDYRLDRINVSVENGVVTEASVG